jgi:hypothetical protein
MHDGLKRLGVDRLRKLPSQWRTDSGVKMAARRRLDGGVHWWGDHRREFDQRRQASGDPPARLRSYHYKISYLATGNTYQRCGIDWSDQDSTSFAEARRRT